MATRAVAPFAPVDQDYLFEARQMQALSFAVHIPIVCFGIAFPAFVLLLEGLWLPTGDYRTIARALVEGDAGLIRGWRRHRLRRLSSSDCRRLAREQA
jgi:hypothetical protein